MKNSWNASTRRGGNIEHTKIARVIGDGDNINCVVLADGSEHKLEGFYIVLKMSTRNAIVDALGCELEESPLGEAIKVNEFKQTTVTNVYAAGDMSNPIQNGTFAVNSGVIAGICVH